MSLPFNITNPGFVLGGQLTSGEADFVTELAALSPSDGDIFVYRSAGSAWTLEAKPAGGSNPAWGDITGTLSAQTDLQSELDGKADTSHTHATTDITSGTFADARIAESNVTQHQAALSITESQISDLGSYLVAADLTPYLTIASAASTYQPLDPFLTDIAGLTDPNDDRILFWDDSAGAMAFLDIGSGLSITGTTISATGGGGTWGSITGTLSDQTDLQSELDGKADTSHTHTASDVTDFDTEVSNNASVVANTAKVGVTTQISNVVEDTTPQLGGDLDLQTFDITAGSTGLIKVDGNARWDSDGSGTLTLDFAAGINMGGPVDMGGFDLTDVQEVRLDATPDSDHSATGPTTNTINAGAAIAIGESVYLASDGEWAPTDASATGTAEALLGVALAAGTDGNPLLVALPGSFVRDDSWNWTVGAQLFLSETAGDLTETGPSTTDSVVRVVGYAVSADVIYFFPQQGVIHE